MLFRCLLPLPNHPVALTQLIVISISACRLSLYLMSASHRLPGLGLSAFACSSSFVCNENNTNINNVRQARLGLAWDPVPVAGPCPRFDNSKCRCRRGIKMHKTRCACASTSTWYWPCPALSRRHTLLWSRLESRPCS